MTGDDRVEMSLEVDRDGDPISGEVKDRLGRSHEFHGWVQLVAAIERARSAGSEQDGSDRGAAREARE